jgi:hypothetical protein
MEVVEIECVPQQDVHVNCGVHVIPNCMSMLTHMSVGAGIASWVPPSKASREKEIPPYRQQLTDECTELKNKKSKKQKTTAIKVKSPVKANQYNKITAIKVNSPRRRTSSSANRKGGSSNCRRRSSNASSSSSAQQQQLAQCS